LIEHWFVDDVAITDFPFSIHHFSFSIGTPHAVRFFVPRVVNHPLPRLL